MVTDACVYEVSTAGDVRCDDGVVVVSGAWISSSLCIYGLTYGSDVASKPAGRRLDRPVEV